MCFFGSVCVDFALPFFCFCRYKAVIDACSLQPDIDILPHGDQTQIGERVSKQLQAFIFVLNV